MRSAARILAVAVLHSLLAGCATTGATQCPIPKDPLLTLRTGSGYVSVSSKELLDWTSYYETLGGGAGRSFLLQSPEHPLGAPWGIVHVIFGRSGDPGDLGSFEPIMLDVLGARGDPVHERSPMKACLGGEAIDGVSFLVDLSTHRGRVPYRIEVFQVPTGQRRTIIRAFVRLDNREAREVMRGILARTVWH